MPNARTKTDNTAFTLLFRRVSGATQLKCLDACLQLVRGSPMSSLSDWLMPAMQSSSRFYPLVCEVDPFVLISGGGGDDDDLEQRENGVPRESAENPQTIDVWPGETPATPRSRLRPQKTMRITSHPRNRSDSIEKTLGGRVGNRSTMSRNHPGMKFVAGQPSQK